MMPIIGLMSGTSMDGINATIVETDGIKLNRTNISTILKYQKQTKTMLLESLKDPIAFIQNKFLKGKLEDLIAIDHAKSVKLTKEKCHLIPKYISFHGQTIFHNPQKKTTIQLGNANLLANLTGIDVISNFRETDILNGGQGAPLAPIYHLNIMKQIKLNLPSVLLNIGGVSNITYYDGHQLIGFDIGPGNGLMDSFVQSFLNIPYDKDGVLASKGEIFAKFVKKFENNQFFKLKHPKSIDRFHFNKLYNLLIKQNLSHSDTLSTLLEFTVSSVKIALNQLPEFPKQLIVIGGGEKNKFLIKRLKKVLKIEIFISNEFNIPGEMIEAELMAFIGARSLKNIPYTFPQTTGVSSPSSGGKLYKADNNYKSEF